VCDSVLVIVAVRDYSGESPPLRPSPPRSSPPRAALPAPRHFLRPQLVVVQVIIVQFPEAAPLLAPLVTSGATSLKLAPASALLQWAVARRERSFASFVAVFFCLDIVFLLHAAAAFSVCWVSAAQIETVSSASLSSGAPSAEEHSASSGRAPIRAAHCKG
jgi:hypothetical protein